MTEYDEFYASRDFKHFKLADQCFIKSVIKVLNIQPKSYVLDVGCGTGKYSKYLTDCKMNVLGIDLSQTAIEIAKRRCEKANFISGDATIRNEILENQQFDVIFCHGFSIFNYPYQLIPDKIEPIVDALKNNGYFIFGKTTNLSDDQPVQGKSRVDYDLSIFANIFNSIKSFKIIGQYTLQPHLFIFFGHYAFNEPFSNLCGLFTKLTNIPLRAYILMQKCEKYE